MGWVYGGGMGWDGVRWGGVGWNGVGLLGWWVCVARVWKGVWIRVDRRRGRKKEGRRWEREEKRWRGREGDRVVWGLGG